MAQQRLYRQSFLFFLTFVKLCSILYPKLTSALSSSPLNNKNNSNAKKNTVNNNSNSCFSLSSYQKSRAVETSKSLDASRLHYQILFVDDDNAKGRIAEGLLAKIAEQNDAMFILFPSSSTISSNNNAATTAPTDATAPTGAVEICASLGLCPVRSQEIGTFFDLSYLHEYDLIITLHDHIRSRLLRAIALEYNNDDQEYYEPRIRSLSEFLSTDFCGAVENSKAASGNDLLLDMLDFELRDRVAPFSDYIIDSTSRTRGTRGSGTDTSDNDDDNRFFFNDDVIVPKSAMEAYYSIPKMVLTEDGAAVANMRKGSWPVSEAAMILASAGITKFCLDTIDAQFDMSFQNLLDINFGITERFQNMNWEEADDQLRRCSSSVTGYFSREERKIRYDKHCANIILSDSSSATN